MRSQQSGVQPFRPISADYQKWKFLKGTVVVIEGGIANGKTTLMKNMAGYLGDLGFEVAIFPEPIMDIMLQLFLADQPKYAFAFQIAMMMKRREIYQLAQKEAELGKIVLVDRSMHGDMCFATMHRENGNISEQEWEAYSHEFLEGQLPHPDYVIYLDVAPETAIERCMARDRKGEKDGYDVQYFTDLKATYEKIIPASFNAIRIDWNMDRTTEPGNVGVLLVLNRIRKAFSDL